MALIVLSNFIPTISHPKVLVKLVVSAFIFIKIRNTVDLPNTK